MIARLRTKKQPDERERGNAAYRRVMRCLTATEPASPRDAEVARFTVDCGKSAVAEISRFQGSNGVVECHITVRLTSGSDGSARTLHEAYHRVLNQFHLNASTAVFRRIFCSDVANQADKLSATFRSSGDETCALSIIGQPPLPAAKLALWAYHVVPVDGCWVRSGDGITSIYQKGGLCHHWVAGMTGSAGRGSLGQTREVLDDYVSMLGKHDMRLADDAVRTWWFLRDIDCDYDGFVQARRAFFEEHGLNESTHYLASTGIAGTHACPTARLSFDSYAVRGLQPGQMRFLTSPEFICPTHDYGVTFERATAIHYADRNHVFISGTASIDRFGQVVHEGDVIAQLDRTLENIGALLADGGAKPGDLAAVLVYLRDPADGARVRDALIARLGNIPFVMAHAAVCRPGWLIEIEGMAIASAQDPDMPEF